MDYSYILNLSVPDINKLKEFGFNKKNSSDANDSDSDDTLILKKQIEGEDFYAIVELTKKSVTAFVYENETNEKYTLFDVKKANGSFVNKLRSSVQSLIDLIKEKCFITTDVKKKYEDFIQKNFNVMPDYPWKDTPDFGVYRNKDNKWFALIMKIKFKNIGLDSLENVWVVNLKAEDIQNITDNISVFPAYHMNKKYWITVLLTDVTDFNKLCDLTKKSFNLVCRKKN